MDWISFSTTLLAIVSLFATLFPEQGKAFVLFVFQPLAPRRFTRISGSWRAEFDLTLDDGSVVKKTELVRVRQVGSAVHVFPLDDRTRVRIRARLRDNHYLTGTWFHLRKGSAYHGAFQLVVDPMGDCMDGTWVGYSRLGMVQHGSWIWNRLVSGEPNSKESLLAQPRSHPSEKMPGDNLIRIADDIEKVNPGNVGQVQ